MLLKSSGDACLGQQSQLSEVLARAIVLHHLLLSRPAFPGSPLRDTKYKHIEALNILYICKALGGRLPNKSARVCLGLIGSLLPFSEPTPL